MDVREKQSSEKRLIDADRALEIVHDQRIAHPNAYHLTNYATLILRDAPTVDAVEVVRCMECKFRSSWMMNRNLRYICPESGMFPNGENDFCSYGERKDGDGNG